MRQLRKQDIEALEVMEGKVPYVYDDSKYPTRPYKPGEHVAGTLTGGVGHTGSDLTKWIGKTIPDSQIKAWLDRDTDEVERWVNSLGIVLNDNQFAAIVFWGFNVGLTAAQNSTLAKKLRAGDFDAIPDELRKWTKTTIRDKDGKRRKITSNGLIKRRADEIAYWLADPSVAPKPVPRPAHKPTGTQVGEPETPKTVTLETVATGASILSGLLSAATDGPIAYALAGILVVGAAVALYAFVTKRAFAG